MSPQAKKYCLDANVLIQAWQKYYSPKICPDYWVVLNELGVQGRIFLPQMVFEEITRTDDDLSKWLKESNIPKYKIDTAVTECLKSIYTKDPMHKVTAKYQVTIPPEVRKEMGIIPGTEVEIAKKGEKYVLIVNPVETVKKKWRGKFKSEPTTMEYLDEIRGKVN